MRIGFFTDSYFPSIDGVTYTIKAWRERLEERGHEVYIVYPEADYEPDENEIPVKSISNPFYPQYRIPLYMRASNLPELDIVHCHGPASTGLLGRRYANKNNIRSVYTHHTPVEDYLIRGLKSEILADLAGKLYVKYENNLLKSFDCVTASTSRIERDIEPEKLPVGIEMDFFKPKNETMFKNKENPVIGYSGRMSTNKNIEEILKLAEKMEDYNFILIGEGPTRNNLEKRAPENVQFRDFLERENLPRFYSSIDVFITASTCDTLGLSPLEANACGTPVAAADVEPFKRTINQKNGARFEYRNVEEMEKAVIECLNKDKDTREKVQKFSLEKTIDKLEQIYGVN